MWKVSWTKNSQELLHWSMSTVILYVLWWTAIGKWICSNRMVTQACTSVFHMMFISWSRKSPKNQMDLSTLR
jgi:hypothetical protein